MLPLCTLARADALPRCRGCSIVAAALRALEEDTARGGDAARRAVADNTRRLEGTHKPHQRAAFCALFPTRVSLSAALSAGAYFSGRTLSTGEEVFPLAASVDGHTVRLSRAPPLQAFAAAEQLPASLAPYLHLDASGAPVFPPGGAPQ